MTQASYPDIGNIETLPPVVKDAFNALKGSANPSEWFAAQKNLAAPDYYSAGYSPSAFGKSIFITDGGNSDIYTSHSKLSDFATEFQVADKLRARCGLYWTDEHQEDTTSDSLIYANKLEEVKNHAGVKMHFKCLGPSYPITESSDLPFGSSIHYVVLEAKNYVDGYGDQQPPTPAHLYTVMSDSAKDIGTWYHDHTIRAANLSKKQDVERMGGGGVGLYTAYADIHGDYNYYMSSYENTIQLDTVSEATIPNMYVFFAFNESESPNPDLKKHLTLDGLIEIKNHQAMFMPNSQYEQAVSVSPGGLYLEQWGRVYGKAASQSPSTTSYLGTKFQNILMPIGDMGMFAKQNMKKELFPMWMNLEFTTDSRTSFAEALKDSQLAGTFERDLLDAVLDPNGSVGLEDYSTFEAESISSPVSTATSVEATQMSTKTVFSPTASRRTFDISSWFKDLTNFQDDGLEGLFDGYDTANSTFVGTYNSETKISNDPKYNFFKTLMAIILSGKLREIVKNQMRDFASVMEGDACQHETVLYRVTKHAGKATHKADGTEITPIQTFYLPNSNDIDVYQYIDTQVKYDKEYTYTIYGYELVVGTKYKYLDFFASLSYGNYGLARIEVAPSLKLMEIPVYKYTTRVLDEPPVMPDIEFVPFKGINNKIRILLNGSVGRYTMMPETIEPAEDAMIEKFRMVQDVLDTEPIKYEADDFAEFFEIWRLNERPTSYHDFSGQLRATVPTDANPDTLLKATTATFDDKLKPNKKYYYCIRSIDNHGHISYPTPIYEVEIVDDKGSIYPLIKTVDFAEKTQRQPSIGLKRYMQIVPTMPQTLVNEVKSGIEDTTSVQGKNIVLGLPDEVLWGKKFKVRLTSKSTGKKIDFNLQFTHKHLSEDEGGEV